MMDTFGVVVVDFEVITKLIMLGENGKLRILVEGDKQEIAFTRIFLQVELPVHHLYRTTSDDSVPRLSDK